VRFAIYASRSAVWAAAALAIGLVPGAAQPTNQFPKAGNSAAALPLPGSPITNSEAYPIDLPTALRLAGARNLDIQIAQQRLTEAQANHQSAVEQFFPWIAPGIGYHRRDGVAQSVPSGIISDAHFQSYSPGVALSAQIVLGDAIYNSLAAKQLVQASDQVLERQRQDAILSAAQGYFDLARAGAQVEVIRDAIRISQDYQQQLHAAVIAGIAFRGDELRVQTQTEQYRISLEQALEQGRVAGVTLAQILHLDARVALVAQEGMITPVALFSTNAPMNALVERALRERPELKQTQAELAASRASKNGAVYGPLIPVIGAQVYGGGLGGGPDGGPSNLGAEGDYLVGLSWRIGPGGLFDAGRINAVKARLAVTQLAESKLRDIIIGEVVSSLTRVKSAGAQIGLAEQNLSTATETLRLTQQRKQFGIGIVLEDIQAQQAVTQARSSYVTALAEFNKAQYSLNRAAGGYAELEQR
jgi:outer membrane protein TolC